MSLLFRSGTIRLLLLSAMSLLRLALAKSRVAVKISACDNFHHGRYKNI